MCFLWRGVSRIDPPNGDRCLSRRGFTKGISSSAHIHPELLTHICWHSVCIHVCLCACCFASPLLTAIHTMRKKTCPNTFHHFTVDEKLEGGGKQSVR
uniref:Uncharacterized protein n=1 Tax=Lates calcarifer TaxID=8187 RepID=A0A4W6EJI7_LATCA